jgi:hypothetical protein
VSLPEALALGERLGYRLPKQIDILAVEAQDVTTLGGDLSPGVRASLPQVSKLATAWAAGHPMAADFAPELVACA